MDEAQLTELTDEEIQQAKDIIKRSMPGTYKLRILYTNKIWSKIKSPTTFGTRFKQTVLKNKLDSIEIHPEKTGSNATLYIVHGG